MANKCTASKKNGSKCSADAQIGKDVCVFHDPEKADVVRQARQAGGVRRSQPLAVLPPDTPDCQIHDASDVRELLTTTINQVRRGELDVRFANAIGYLATIVMGALLEGDKEKRLARLEAKAGLDGSKPDFGRDSDADSNIAKTAGQN